MAEAWLQAALRIRDAMTEDELRGALVAMKDMVQRELTLLATKTPYQEPEEDSQEDES